MSHTEPAAQKALAAWHRLARALATADQELRKSAGVTSEQAAICRLLSEKDAWPMTDLRRHLKMHPATLSQLLSRLERRGLIAISNYGTDRRRHQVALTEQGQEMLAVIPMVGPTWLTSTDASIEDLEMMEKGFNLAVTLFGIEKWATEL